MWACTGSVALAATQPLERARRAAERVPAGLHERVPLDRGAARRGAARPGGCDSTSRGMTTNSEPLTPGASRADRVAFGVRPTDFYATTEGLCGHECPRGLDAPVRRHVHRRERGRRRSPRPPGEVGSRLLVTNLFNRVQPLIRFEISGPRRCRPRAVPVRARAHAAAVARGPRRGRAPPGDVAVHPLQFGIVTADPDVREFQVVQQGDALLLRVALRDGAAGRRGAARSRLRRPSQRARRPGPLVRVERVDALERSPRRQAPARGRRAR